MFANVGMPYRKRGNIKEEKKTHPRELPLHSQNSKEEGEGGGPCAPCFFCNTPSRKDCTFSTLAMSSQHVNPLLPYSKSDAFL
jgi:hypothetical protein